MPYKRKKPERTKFDASDPALLAHLLGQDRAKPGRLTLDDLYREVALVANLSLTDATRVVDTVFGMMQQELQQWQQVRITRFGTFRPWIQPPKVHVLPKVRTRVPAHFAPTFEPSLALLRDLNPHQKEKYDQLIAGKNKFRTRPSKRR